MVFIGAEEVLSSLLGGRWILLGVVLIAHSRTSSIADLLTQARPPLSGTVDQLTRVAPLLSNDDDKARMDLALQKAPENYRKLVRLGSYGSFINQYLCGMNVRVTDLQGRTAYFPWIMQNTGRCGEP